MAKGSSGLMIRIRICNTSSRQKAPGTCAKGIGTLPRTAGGQLKADGKYRR